MSHICPDKDTVFDCIEYYKDRSPGALCCSIRVEGQWLFYSRREFWDYVCNYAAVFQNSLKEQTLILFVKKLDIHLLAAYIGAMKAGHLPAQISPLTAKVHSAEYRKKIEHIHDITKFGAVFTDFQNIGNYTDVERVQIFSPESLDESLYFQVGIVSEDALIQFSSGSTGLQKGVVLTHKGVVAHMKSYGETLRLSADDKIVSWLPLYHDMGLIACYLMPLMCGIPFYQMDPFDWIMQPDLLLRLIEEKRATVCFLPNFAYQFLVNKGNVHDLSSMRLWINCSEPTRLHSHERFMDKFPTVREESLTVCYALAENTFAVSQTLPWHNNSTRFNEKRNVLSCGIPINEVAVRIFPSENLGDGEIGIRSPFLFKRFLGSGQTLRDGFYLTGDIGFIDDKGELYITGRKKDVIIVCGKNIYPQDVEFVVSEVNGIYPGRVTVFGVWDEQVGSEGLIVLAECKEKADTIKLKMLIQKAVQEEIGIVPKRVEILKHMSLVKTSSGKISRARNKEIYLAKEFDSL